MAQPATTHAVRSSLLLGFDDRYASLFGTGTAFPQVVSDTQAYRQFGNAVVPKVVEAIGAGILSVMADSIVASGRGTLLAGRANRSKAVA